MYVCPGAQCLRISLGHTPRSGIHGYVFSVLVENAKLFARVAIDLLLQPFCMRIHIVLHYFMILLSDLKFNNEYILYLLSENNFISF